MTIFESIKKLFKNHIQKRKSTEYKGLFEVLLSTGDIVRVESECYKNGLNTHFKYAAVHASSSSFQGYLINENQIVCHRFIRISQMRRVFYIEVNRQIERSWASKWIEV